MAGKEKKNYIYSSMLCFIIMMYLLGCLEINSFWTACHFFAGWTPTLDQISVINYQKEMWGKFWSWDEKTLSTTSLSYPSAVYPKITNTKKGNVLISIYLCIQYWIHTYFGDISYLKCPGRQGLKGTVRRKLMWVKIFINE